jgi:hypothetical protein
VTRSRPLCPWPQTAIYSGSGSANEAANWHCGGNVETKEMACLDLVAKFQKEDSNAYHTVKRANPATCNAHSNVPIDDASGHPAVAPHFEADESAAHYLPAND